GLRRNRRQDEEQVLRHARDARPPAVRGREVRAQRRRQRRIEGVPQQEAPAGNDLEAPQQESRHPGSGLGSPKEQTQPRSTRRETKNTKKKSSSSCFLSCFRVFVVPVPRLNLFLASSV